MNAKPRVLGVLGLEAEAEESVVVAVVVVGMCME
jgi:hypothetical protein